MGHQNDLVVHIPIMQSNKLFKPHDTISLFQFASSLEATTDDYKLISLTNHSDSTTPHANRAHGNGTSAFYSPTINNTQQPSSQCIFPSYFSHFAILILIAISVVTQLSHLTKTLLMMIVTGELMVTLSSPATRSISLIEQNSCL